MVELPAKVKDFLVRPGPVKMLVTADASGQPRGIVCGSIFVPKDDIIAVGEVMMVTTKKNLSENYKVAITAAEGAEAYCIYAQVAGRVDGGPLLEGLNEKLSKVNLKAAAVWTFSVNAVFDESAGPGAGRRIA